MKNRTHQSGFGSIGILIVLVVLLAIGGIGYTFIRQHKTTASQTPASSTAKNSPASNEAKPQAHNADATPFVNVIQDDGSVRIVTAAAIAKTKDQKDILTDLHMSCKDPRMSNITLSSNLFEEDGRYKQSGKYARFSAQVCNPPIKTLQELEGSGRDILVRKAASGTWFLDSQGQMEAPGCALIDGKEYPVSLVPTCLLSDGTQRQPKQ